MSLGARNRSSRVEAAGDCSVFWSHAINRAANEQEEAMKRAGTARDIPGVLDEHCVWDRLCLVND